MTATTKSARRDINGDPRPLGGRTGGRSRVPDPVADRPAGSRNPHSSPYAGVFRPGRAAIWARAVTVETQILPPRYRDARQVGRGGMGEIYRATDDSLGRDVAVKLLSEHYAQDENVRERFTREALAAARLSGRPNVVTIFDVGDWHGRPYIVMEYLGGGSLGDVVSRNGAVAVGQTIRWLEQAATALDAAHGEGIVHRDVKPANLLLDVDGNVHVADFGVASAAGLDSLTKTGTVLGTAGYLSP
ncbi:MAG TPA: serine/threonine-protein kinase, partial [Gaiellaceae bacterium]|nr:serine/threonine-protein kinase [Gaiellaceae bacterium]